MIWNEYQNNKMGGWTDSHLLCLLQVLEMRRRILNITPLQIWDSEDLHTLLSIAVLCLEFLLFFFSPFRLLTTVSLKPLGIQSYVQYSIHIPVSSVFSKTSCWGLTYLQYLRIYFQVIQCNGLRQHESVNHRVTRAFAGRGFPWECM